VFRPLLEIGKWCCLFGAAASGPDFMPQMFSNPHQENENAGEFGGVDFDLN